MPPVAGTAEGGAWHLFRGLAFPILVVASVAVILLPLPAVVLDLFLAGNITISVLILLTTVYVGKALEFSVFPALLLGTTLIRLVLNLASTRLILTNGATEKTAAAGHVIQAFGEFVAGDKLVVGCVLFMILNVIQFLVITKGAGRISEVTARFFLDSLPGKQMAIDAELNAGILNEASAKARRAEIVAQADFYASMEGASKFVRGDAIAGMVIMVINIVGGLYVGCIENGMALGEAVEVFTKLTIGDGLVTQVPAFLVSLASGLIVTRTSAESDLSRDMLSQLFKHPKMLYVSAIFLIFLSVTGLPKLPMYGLAGACAAIGYSLQKREDTVAKELEDKKEPVDDAAVAAQDQFKKRVDDAEVEALKNLKVEPIVVEVGLALVQLIKANEGTDSSFMSSILRLRVGLAKELGLLLPSVTTRDNLDLEKLEYRILIRGAEVARNRVYPNSMLAIAPKQGLTPLRGLEVIEPSTETPGVWIESAFYGHADNLGYTLLEPTDVMLLHLSDVIRGNAADLLTRQRVHELIATLTEDAGKLVAEATSEKVRITVVHMVLRNLLQERVPIRDLETILQSIVDNIDRVGHIAQLTEVVRTTISRTICQKNQLKNSRLLHVINLDPVLEEFLKAKIEWDPIGLGMNTTKLSREEGHAITDAIKAAAAILKANGLPPVVLTTSSHSRAAVRSLISRALPRVSVMTMGEITRDTELTTIEGCYVDKECLRAVLMAQMPATAR